MAHISLQSITKKYGNAVALDDVSLEVADGELLVLLGPSGCGKSTLLRVMAGLIQPDRGRVRLGGRDVSSLPPRERDVAMVFQSYALYPHLSVRRNLGFGLRARGRPRREIEDKVTDVARRLGLEALLGRRPKDLSGGQRQRVALGRAMVRDPAVFLMDEPLSNLDAQLRASTRIELAEIHRGLSATFVYVTHDQVEAMTLATRIAVLNEGRLEQLGSPAEIYDEPASMFVAGFLGAPPMNLLPATAVGRDGRVRLEGTAVQADLWAGDLAQRPVVLGIRPERVRITPIGPNDVRMTAEVTAVENLGSEEVAICRAGGAQVCVRGPRPLGLTAGQPVELHASADDILLFDPASGGRLRWVPDPDELSPSAAVAHDVR